MTYSIRPNRPPRPTAGLIISQENNEVIQQAGQHKTISPERLTQMIQATRSYEKFPYGLQLSEIRAQDIEAALLELKERREIERYKNTGGLETKTVSDLEKLTGQKWGRE